jgi:hypothetical protein
MKAVRVLAPSGSDLLVFEVVVEIDKKVRSFLRTLGGGGPSEVEGRYASLQQALSRNSRSVTTAEMVDVRDLQEARAMVEA